MADKEPNFQMTFAFIDRQIDSNIIQQRLWMDILMPQLYVKLQKKGCMII
mgnify:CR=1 FL=1